MNIETAIARLNAQLPLKARQNRLSKALKAAHQCVLTTLVNQGRPPTIEELTIVLGKEPIEQSLQRLGTDDLVVLNAQGTQPVGAYPITIENTPHKISVNGHTIHAMCALDAVSVAPMFDTHVVIESTCRGSATAITIQMLGSQILEVQPSDDVTIGIRWQMPSTVAAHSMCTEMVFFKDRPTAKTWQNGDTDTISLFSLLDAVAFGKAFFLPLLE